MQYFMKPKEDNEMECWKGFKGTTWKRQVDVRDFIQSNYVPYEGDESFLASPTEATKTLWAKVMDYMKKESQNNGVYDVDTERVSTITSHAPGYIDKDLEKIVGIQTDTPLKRAIFPRISLAQTKRSA